MFKNQSYFHKPTSLPTPIHEDVETLAYFSLHQVGDVTSRSFDVVLKLYNTLLPGYDLAFTLLHTITYLLHYKSFRVVVEAYHNSLSFHLEMGPAIHGKAITM